MLTGRGFGFVSRESGPDVLIPFDHLGVAASGDMVTVELFPESPGDKPAGRVTSVIERSPLPIVGRVQWKDKQLRLYPEGQRLNRALILDRKSVERLSGISDARRDIRNGDVMSADLGEWSDPSAHPVGTAREFIGRRDDPDSEISLIAQSRGFERSFPNDVTRAAEKLSLPSGRSTGESRRDLRSEICFTVDPESARDFDDAISVRQRRDGLLEVSVHIADVSHYVEQDDPIDKEAWKRSTSVYLVDTVIPMLPERLSNELCSIVPKKDRLAMTVRATLDSTGDVKEHEIFESIIKSRRRFTYREVEEIIHGKKDHLSREIHLLHLVTQQLRRRREEDGSVDLDLSSPQIKLDDNGVPVSIRSSERLLSQKMIEESMLLANRLVAEELQRRRGPGIYRVHDQPRATDVTSLIDTLLHLGIRYKVEGEFTPDDYRNILGIIENLEFRDFVEAIAMRSLNKAVYDVENRGHFGLAMKAYTHFTSPIRRYPDLVVHRLLKHTVKGRGGRLQAYLKETCENASARERAATSAERAYTRLKALQYLEKRRGRRYAGTVSGVTSFGLFVEIDRYLVEGLVPIATLGKERFELIRAEHRLEGRKSGIAFRLGDRVRIEVTKVDVEERRAEFRLVEE